MKTHENIPIKLKSNNKQHKQQVKTTNKQRNNANTITTPNTLSKLKIRNKQANHKQTLAKLQPKPINRKHPEATNQNKHPTP